MGPSYIIWLCIQQSIKCGHLTNSLIRTLSAVPRVFTIEWLHFTWMIKAWTIRSWLMSVRKRLVRGRSVIRQACTEDSNNIASLADCKLFLWVAVVDQKCTESYPCCIKCTQSCLLLSFHQAGKFSENCCIVRNLEHYAFMSHGQNKFGYDSPTIMQAGDRELL